jgi:U3 small nucleolar RNA-associated protein 10
VKDSLNPKPTLSRILLGVGSEDGRDPHQVSIDLLHTLSHLLKHTSLNSKMSRSFQSDDTEQSSRIRAQFSHILEENLLLADTAADIKPVSQACGDLLESLLGVLSLVDFIDTVGVLLQRPNDRLRRKVLRLLESRLRRDIERDSVSQTKILDFLSTLTKIIEESPDILLKHAAVACIDRISDRYGKKDRSKVVETAKVISGKQCIGQTDDRIRVMGVLCLASMAEVLGQAIIPVLPQALPQAFNLLELSLKKEKENSRLHDAVFSLISALLEHVPFMILDTSLDSILKLSFRSANSDMSEESIESRREVLSLVAKRVDAGESFGAVQRNWPYAVSEGVEVSCFHTCTINALELPLIGINRPRGRLWRLSALPSKNILNQRQ